jgi:hypothetical protein
MCGNAGAGDTSIALHTTSRTRRAATTSDTRRAPLNRTKESDRFPIPVASPRTSTRAATMIRWAHLTRSVRVKPLWRRKRPHERSNRPRSVLDRSERTGSVRRSEDRGDAFLSTRRRLPRIRHRCRPPGPGTSNSLRTLGVNGAPATTPLSAARCRSRSRCRPDTAACRGHSLRSGGVTSPALRPSLPALFCGGVFSPGIAAIRLSGYGDSRDSGDPTRWAVPSRSTNANSRRP